MKYKVMYEIPANLDEPGAAEEMWGQLADGMDALARQGRRPTHFILCADDDEDGGTFQDRLAATDECIEARKRGIG